MELKEVIRQIVRDNIKESISEMSQNDVHFKNIMRLYDHGGSFTKKKVAVAVCKNPNASRAKIIDYLMDTDYNEIIDIQDELNIHEALVKEAQGRIPKLFLKIEAVKKEIDRLTAERKSKFGGEYARKLNAETDAKKRENLKEPILAISKKITALQKNLFDLYDMEEKYIQNLDKDAELELESAEGDKIQNLNNRIKVLKDKISATKNSEQKSKFQNTLKNALQSLSNIKKAHGIKAPHNESVNEAASVEAMGIAALTGLRGDAVQKFIDDNNIHARKLFAFLKMKGPHTLSNRMDISTAIVGKANNKYAQGIIKAFSESKINEAKFEVYHNSYTSAINAAREYAEKQGYTINDDDSFTKIGMGPRKPSEGKTNKFSIELSKDDKVQRKQLHIQVYGMRTKYELNCYIG
jgi:uncharacterized small protein (DUF1192 family)